jgi:hypothetical protein
VNANCPASGGKALHEPWLAVPRLAIYHIAQISVFDAILAKVYTSRSANPQYPRDTHLTMLIVGFII